MIRELSELGKKIRVQNSEQKLIHDALKEEPVSIDLVINEDGSFHSFISFEKKMTTAEAITAKKGKARLLLDKPEEVLCYGGEKSVKKYKLFIEKIKQYEDLKELSPVLIFYGNNKINGLDKALLDFEQSIPEKERNGNIAFRVLNASHRIHEETAVQQKIIEKYESRQESLLAELTKKCSICGKNDYPVIDLPHGMIKRVPDGQTSGCALVSYNENAFESYELKGNNNSSICTNCAKTYVEGLNHLLSNGNPVIVKDKKGKEKESFRYTNRKNFGSDTAMVFWTRENTNIEEIDLLDNPDPQEVSNLIDSVASGNIESSKYTVIDQFYSCTISGAAARVAVRDWIETSLDDFRKSIAKWFEDIKISYFDYDSKENKIYYPRLYDLAKCCKNEKNTTDVMLERTASYLWNAAIKNTSLPLWMLNAVLKRARLINTDENKKRYDGITRERASLIRLILNRNNKGGGFMINEKLDLNNDSTAYVCGRIFAVLESIQRVALGKNINAGIRERFFTFASTNPSPAFGRLMKLSQNHISKLRGEKPGLAVVLDKELGELVCKIQLFPVIFSLEEQGQFAIGYYHQKQAQFNKKELKETIEEEEENE